MTLRPFEPKEKLTKAKFNLSVSVYNRRATDQIDWFRVSEDDKWMPDNFNRANYFGFEMVSKMQWGNSKKLHGNMALSYSYINASFEENDFAFSRNALENLRHQFVLTPSLNWNNFEVLLVGKYNDRVSLEDYFLLDTNLSYSFLKYRLYLKANNTTDANYRETNLVDMPGRWLKIGAVINL